MANLKDPIRLRKRQLRNGNISLYFDIYIDGKRSYEFLNLYLVPEKTRADKDKNKETLRLADAIRATRIIDLQNGRFGFNNRTKQSTNFLDYFEMLCEKRLHNAGSISNGKTWYCTLKHLKNFCRPGITFRDITLEFAKGFKDYLDKTTFIRTAKSKEYSSEDDILKLSNSTKNNYLDKFRACINQAIKDGIIQINPLRGLEKFKEEEHERVYLTLEEIKAMAIADCKYPALRQAFLFSCLTGLRKSDIEKMTWSEVRQQGEFTRIVFKQKKTGGQEYIDLNPQAAAFMGERGAPEDLVFPGFTYSPTYLVELKRWAARAGITKDLTFHSGRHTFAVMILDLGADIFTLQKLLGHKEIKTTQIYARLMDKKKQEAAMLIPPILPIESDME